MFCREWGHCGVWPVLLVTKMLQAFCCYYHVASFHLGPDVVNRKSSPRMKKTRKLSQTWSILQNHPVARLKKGEQRSQFASLVITSTQSSDLQCLWLCWMNECTIKWLQLIFDHEVVQFVCIIWYDRSVTSHLCEFLCKHTGCLFEVKLCVCSLLWWLTQFTDIRSQV